MTRTTAVIGVFAAVLVVLSVLSGRWSAAVGISQSQALVYIAGGYVFLFVWLMVHASVKRKD